MKLKWCYVICHFKLLKSCKINYLCLPNPSKTTTRWRNLFFKINKVFVKCLSIRTERAGCLTIKTSLKLYNFKNVKKYFLLKVRHAKFIRPFRNCLRQQKEKFVAVKVENIDLIKYSGSLTITISARYKFIRIHFLLQIQRPLIKMQSFGEIF